METKKDGDTWNHDMMEKLGVQTSGDGVTMAGRGGERRERTGEKEVKQ